MYLYIVTVMYVMSDNTVKIVPVAFHSSRPDNDQTVCFYYEDMENLY